jgi:acyl-CoA synthetase (NDP forming)
MTENDGCSNIMEQALRQQRSALLIDEAQRVCEIHQIPTPESHLVTGANEAVERANELGYPVVLKIVSPQIIHKTDSSGVVLNVQNEKEVSLQYQKLIDQIKSREPSAMIRGVLIEKMMPPSTELIVGGLRDKQFGPSVMFGIGGIFAEVYNDIIFRVAPIDPIDALNMIHGLRGSLMLEGIRGAPPLDLDAIAKVLTNVSDIMCQHDAVTQMDLNPIIAYPKGAYAVDSRIILAEGGV